MATGQRSVAEPVRHSSDHGNNGRSDVKNEVNSLRRELTRFKRQLRHNEEIWAVFRRIEIAAIGAESVPELVRVVTEGIEQNLPKVIRAAIGCVDLDYEISRLLESTDNGADDLSERLILLSEDELARLMLDPGKPMLGQSNPRINALLFGGDEEARVSSIAVSPLSISGRLIGYLAQGSENPRHFAPGSSTDLLEHLSSTLALCLQNTVNKARLERHGLTDPLTGVGNRRLLESRLREEIDRCQRHGHELTTLIVDIDHFKQVNDVHGHAIGDRVLRQVAELLGKDLRSSDILCRYGGEEFVLLLPETKIREGHSIAERMRSELAGKRFRVAPDIELRATVSIGVAGFSGGTEYAEVDPMTGLLGAADEALYAAKRAGRNRVSVHGDATRHGPARATEKLDCRDN